MGEDKNCGSLLKQINDELEKNANNALRSQDLTLSQMGALLELSYEKGYEMSLKELERRLHVAQSTAAGIISRLERKGLVESFGDLQDRRVKMIRLTKTGLERVQASDSHRLQAEEKLLSGLTETERTIFFALLKKVRDSFG